MYSIGGNSAYDLTSVAALASSWSNPGILFLLLLAYAQTPTASAAAIPPSPWNAQQSGTALVFYAQPQVSDDLWPVLFQVLRADLADGAGNMPNGLVWTEPPSSWKRRPRGVTFSKVISVKLLGRCDVLPQTDHPSQADLRSVGC